MNKKMVKILPPHSAFESDSEKSNHFKLFFHFLTPKERDLHCSHEITLGTKITHTYAYYNFIQRDYTANATSQKSQRKFLFTSSKFSTPYFLIFIYCIKILTYTASSVIMIPSDKRRKLFFFTKRFFYKFQFSLLAT